MAYLPAGFTPEQEELLLGRTRTIAERQVQEAKSRKLTVLLSAAAALVAAVRLGLVAWPKFRR